MKNVTIFLMSLSLTLLSMGINAQEVVNKVWEQTTGLPNDNLNYQASTLDYQERLIIVGNTFTQGEAENFLITKYDQTGGALWQKQYNHAPNQTDFATAVTTDNQGNIYVVGATDQTTTSKLDYVVIKLDANGNTQWTQTYDGFGDNDIAIACAVDNNGNVYVTGNSENGIKNYDYLTIKYDSNGNQQWTKRYEYAGLTDIAVGLKLSSNGNVRVTGASAQTVSRWDYATLEYNSSGTLLGSKRHALGIAGFDQPTDMEQDASGNIYITGSASTDGINYDIQTIKLNPNFGLVWAVQWDGHGFEDKALDVELDNNGNLYLTGFTTLPDNTTDIVTIKYDNSGNELWVNQRRADENSEYARQLEINTVGEIYITGTAERGNQTDYLTLRYTPDGEIEWERYFDGGQIDEPRDIRMNSEGDIYITGKSKNNSISEYKTVKYEKLYRPKAVNYNSNGKAISIQNEVIVRFTTPIINTAIVDNPEVKFTTIGQIITDPTAISMMDAAVNAGGEFQNWTVIKVFPEMTSAPKTTTTRQGKQIPTPNFWTTFVLLVPEQIAENNVSEKQVSLQLNTSNLKSYIQYAHPNYIGFLTCVPNDMFYNQQESLTNFSSLTTDIGVEGAWCKGIVGQKHIKVGVYDSGIDYNHQDFDIDGITNKIIDGKHFGTNVPTSSLFNPDDNLNGGHGTPVAGIIGALRSNSVGIAGIAGGDMDFGIDNPGVSLYDMKIADTALISLGDIVRAIKEGAESTNSNGFGLHLVNHSWGIPTDSLNQWGIINILEDAYYFAYRSGVVSVASRGNYDNTLPHDSVRIYPASLNDNWVISVGGSSYSGTFSPFSLHGDNMDIVAPDDLNFVYSLMNVSVPGYKYFTGTSFSAPHATGTAALLLSYWNDTTNVSQKLYQADVEHILELSTYDMNTTGYDSKTGWGLLRTSSALDSIWKDDGFNLIHVPEDGGSRIVGSPVLVGSLMDTIIVSDTISTLLPNTYLGEKYEVSVTYNHQNLLGTGSIRNTWLRNSVAKGYDELTNIPKYYGCELISSSNQQIQAKTYAYKVTHQIDGTPLSPQIWLVDPNDAECPYTLRVAGFTSNTSSPLRDESNIAIGKIFPNPTTNDISIPVFLSENSDISIAIYDINGRFIKSIFSGHQSFGNHLFSSSVQELSQGVYLVQLRTPNAILYKKFVKGN